MSELASPVVPPRLSRQDFNRVREILFETTGIHMSDIKCALVEGRLMKRLQVCAVQTYGAYLKLIAQDRAERQNAIDALTTNETFFFREPAHFEHLGQVAEHRLRRISRPRVWCGASSTGEEPYSIAMVLDRTLGGASFEVLASDISTRVLAKAREAVYPVEDAKDIPKSLRTQYCLKGTGSQTGRFMIHPALRAKLQFEQINLNEALPTIGAFDVIFLRNVMIYFSLETKRQVVARVAQVLKPGGIFYISHSESLHGLTDELRMLKPSIYQKIGASNE